MPQTASRWGVGVAARAAAPRLHASVVRLGTWLAFAQAAIGDVFGPDYATTNSGLQYTAKGTASIAAGWGRRKS